MSEVADNNGVVLLTITKQILEKHCGVPRISGIELSRNMAGTLVTTMRSVADKIMMQK